MKPKALARRTLPRAVAKRALRALLPQQLVEAVGLLRDRRVEKWWNYVTESDADNVDFAATIHHALKSDEEATVAGILAATRAAQEAFDPVVLESIELLTRA